MTSFPRGLKDEIGTGLASSQVRMTKLAYFKLLRSARPAAGSAVLILLFAAVGAWTSPAPAPAADSAAVEDSIPSDITGSVNQPATGQVDLLPAVEQPFKPGERLKFSVRYGVIRAGSAWLEVPEEEDWNGHKVFKL